MRQLILIILFPRHFLSLNFISSSFDKHCVCITEYRVWYRHDSQPEIDEVPDLDYSDYRDLTLDELLSATQGHIVTHMAITRDIPPVDEIAPHLKQLQLYHLPYRDQSDRSVSLCMHIITTNYRFR